MDITAIGSLNGHFPKLPGGDLLIVTGDLTENQTKKEYAEFAEWYQEQDYEKKVLIAGNRDKLIENGGYYFNHEWMGYLQDSGTEYRGIKIWGSPWCPIFKSDIESTAFTTVQKSLHFKFDKIPEDIDILVTHCCPYGIFDYSIGNSGHTPNKGSVALNKIVLNRKRLPKLKYHFFSHVQEHGGRQFATNFTIFANCSIMDKNNKPTNNLIRINNNEI